MSERVRTISWEDPAVLATAARDGRSGLDFMQAIASGELPGPPLGVLLGMEFVSVEPGRVVVAATPAEWMFNPIGSVHGGVAAALLDSVMGCAVQTLLPAGVGYTTSDLQVRYMRGIGLDTGRVLAEGIAVHTGRRHATAEGRVTAQTTGKLLATATTGCLILSS